MKLRKILAILLAAMLLSTGLLTTASAGGPSYRERVQEFEEMKTRKIWINLNQEDAWYQLNASKLYGRRITGVAPDGSWETGPWELLHDNAFFYSKTFSVDGTYFAFAYSFDIVWGTDWPYSGVFWNNPDKRPESVRVMLSGTCRMANIKIYVDAVAVVDVTNCSSHSEWRP